MAATSHTDHKSPRQILRHGGQSLGQQGRPLQTAHRYPTERTATAPPCTAEPAQRPGHGVRDCTPGRDPGFATASQARARGSRVLRWSASQAGTRGSRVQAHLHRLGYQAARPVTVPQLPGIRSPPRVQPAIDGHAGSMPSPAFYLRHPHPRELFHQHGQVAALRAVDAELPMLPLRSSCEYLGPGGSEVPARAPGSRPQIRLTTDGRP